MIEFLYNNGSIQPPKAIRTVTIAFVTQLDAAVCLTKGIAPP